MVRAAGLLHLDLCCLPLEVAKAADILVATEELVAVVPLLEAVAV